MKNDFNWWYVNHKLRKLLDKIDPNHDLITFEMATFRRQIKELCKSKRRMSVVYRWGIPKDNETFTHMLDFILMFEKYSICVTYNSDKKTCSLAKIDTTQEVSVLVDEIKEFPVEETAQTLLKYFPKAKIQIKRK